MDQPDDSLQIGQALDFRNYVTQGDAIHVTGTSKGRGFQGGVKRHGFGGLPASHGSTMHRRTGSVSHMRSQGRVIKGKRLPGHHGVDQKVMRNLEVVQIEKDAPVILVKGSVPGHSGAFVFITKA
jgi:large subunit ribosomal protein L3